MKLISQQQAAVIANRIRADRHQPPSLESIHRVIEAAVYMGIIELGPEAQAWLKEAQS